LEEVQGELTSFSISVNNQGRVSHGPAFFVANIKMKIVDTLPKPKIPKNFKKFAI
jgi:hypothetical protein